MKLEMIIVSNLNNKLLSNIANETTPFAVRERVKYEGWALESIDCNGPDAMYCNENGDINRLSLSQVAVGIRPSVAYSLIKPYSKVVRNIQKDCIEVEFGEYPQYPATEEVQEKLNKGLLEVEKTSKNYTVYNNDEQNPGTIELEEVVDKDGNKYVNKNNIWYMVSPISWIVDEKNDIALSKNIISGGIPYGEYKEPPMTDFEKECERKHPMKFPLSVRRMYELRRVNPTIIEGFLNVVLSKDILPKELKVELSEEEQLELERQVTEERKRLNLNLTWINCSMRSPLCLSSKLQHYDFLGKKTNLEQTKSEMLLDDSLSDGELKKEIKQHIKRK